MEQNQEYVIAGLSTYINAPFVYAGANLIAVVGGGGDACGSISGNVHDGGDGGGVNMDGEDGHGGGGAGGNKSGVLNQVKGDMFEPLTSNIGVFGGNYV